MLHDFFNIFFPEVCCACNSTLFKFEKSICIKCLKNLPYTNFIKTPDNIVEQMFYGRLDIERAYSLVYYNKGTKVQQILHSLKYNSDTVVGFKMGKLLGIEIKKHSGIKYDLIIPLPLHKSKLRKRGYNQAECIALGIEDELKIPVLNNVIEKRTHTETQTNRAKFARWMNVEETFKLTDSGLIEGKNILLVDDVVTTGATLEACGKELLQVKNVKLSIATIACA